MSDKKEKKLVVKPLAMAFLTTPVEEEIDVPKKESARKKKTTREPVVKAADVAASIRKRLNEDISPKTKIENPVIEEICNNKEVNNKKVDNKNINNKEISNKGVNSKEVSSKEVKKAKSVKSSPKDKIKKNLIIEYRGKSYSEADLINRANDIWTKEFNMSLADLKDFELYIKPEDNKAYYVFNKTNTGSFDI